MAKKRSAWLWGCGLGCAAIVLAVSGLIGAGAVWLGRTTKNMESATSSLAALKERYGDPASFTPQADGTIPPERIEAFLSIREASAPAREAIAASLRAMPLSEQEARALKEKPTSEQVLSALSIARSAFGMLPAFGKFFQTRNQAMLDAGMGLGEYSYIYALAYFSWLGHSPDDGPGWEDSAEDGDRKVQVRVGDVVVFPRVGRELRRILKNQMEALGEDAPEDWKRRLGEEIRVLDKNHRRFPWEDGLPEPTRVSLEPFRDRLEAAYNPVTNPFELGRNRKTGRWSYRSE